MSKLAYLLFEIVVITSLAATAGAAGRGVCAIQQGAEQADRKFHEGLEALFAATNELVSAQRAWHRADVAPANERIETALADFRDAQEAFSAVDGLDADLSEEVVIWPGVEESAVTEAFAAIGQDTRPQKSSDVLDVLLKETGDAQEALGNRRFVGEAQDQALVKIIGDIVCRAMNLSSGVAGLIAKSHSAE